MNPANSNPRRTYPRLLYVVSEDWYFLSHRLPMARAARDAGFDVHVATRVVEGGAAIRAEGFTLHAIPFARGTLSPIAAWRTISALRQLHRTISPAICHHVALQACVLGSLAAIGTRIALVNALTGFGYAFIGNDAKARLLRFTMGGLLRFLFGRRGSVALVQNPDDRAGLLAMGISASHIALIPGSGVDTQALQPLPEPAGPVTMAFVGRLLEDKGVRTLVEAQRLLRRRGLQVELLLAGTPDAANPASIGDKEIAAWKREDGIDLLGHVEPIETVWARAHIAVLPSRREGLPKSLLEAAAYGRPMVATDVPGCREIVLPDQTGLLVPVDDPAALADAIATLAKSPHLRARYGAAARRLAVERFGSAAIGKQTVELYARLLNQSRQ
ncbi:MAG: glycosyltransferase family 4 protein [Xanthobacteraceae bacterium]